MANGNYYLGQDPEGTVGNTPRFFYGLRKNENGSMFLQRIDQIKSDDSVEVNSPGPDEGNFNDFEPGVDFYEGIDVNHNAVFENLNYQQYKWDHRSLFYYIDDEGQLIVRINAGYNYPAGLSED